MDRIKLLFPLHASTSINQHNDKTINQGVFYNILLHPVNPVSCFEKSFQTITLFIWLRSQNKAKN